MKLYFGIALLLFSFPVQSDDVSCENPQTTVAINICSSRKVAVAESELDNYLATATEKYAFEIKTIEALKESQNAWLLYRKTYCDAIYTLWSMGTVRGVKFNGCLLELTRQRTHTIWSNYLTYADSTEPLLPEPN